MDILVDLESPVPLFTQLIEQIKQAVLQDLVQPGDALPSIRQLANDLNLNTKTIAKAYRLLERDSVIETRGYRGTFVHPDAKSKSQIDLGAVVAEKLNQTVADLRKLGATDSEIRVAFGHVMNNRN